MNWRKSAECLRRDPDLFFPVGKAEPAQRQTEEAKSVCLGCEVRGRCLEAALRMRPHPEGVWGATDEVERRELRRGPATPAAKVGASKSRGGSPGGAGRRRRPASTAA